MKHPQRLLAPHHQGFKKPFPEFLNHLGEAHRSDWPVDRHDADAELYGYSLPTYPLCSESRDFGSVENSRRPPQALTFGPGIAKPRLHPFNDQAALQFGYGSENCENHLAGWSAGVELL
jgi:hypothetical protein